MTQNGNGHHPAANGRDPRGNGRNPAGARDACGDEMRLLAGIDAEAELLVRGQAPDGADPELLELAALAREVRSAYAQPPAEAIRERQLAAIVAEADAISAGSAVAASREHGRASTRIPPARRGRTFAFRLAATGLAALVGVAGLAVAGVRPPTPIDSLLERVGVRNDDANRTPPASEDAPPVETPNRGEARRDRSANGGEGGGRPASQGDRATRSQGDEQRSETGTVNSEPGRTTADDAQSGQTPPPSPGRSEEHRSDNAPPPPPAPPAEPGSQGQGQANGRPESPGNSTFGQQQADEAREAAPGLQR